MECCQMQKVKSDENLEQDARMGREGRTDSSSHQQCVCCYGGSEQNIKEDQTLRHDTTLYSLDFWSAKVFRNEGTGKKEMRS